MIHCISRTVERKNITNFDKYNENVLIKNYFASTIQHVIILLFAIVVYDLKKEKQAENMIRKKRASERIILRVDTKSD